MAADIISVLDHENISSVVGIGHDWGTYLLTHLILWHPERIKGSVFVSVAFHVPGREMNVEVLNEMTKRIVGYEALGYWLFFIARDAGKVIGRNVSITLFSCRFLLRISTNPALGGRWPFAKKSEMCHPTTR